MKILVAGGAGYIGSNICYQLEDAGHKAIVLDSLITGRQSFGENHIFYPGDIGDYNILKRIVKEQGELDCVIHLAALSIVPESHARVYDYYKNNVAKTIEFLNNLNMIGCKRLIFSSSASVYGDTKVFEVKENNRLNPNSPYAKTKAMLEEIICDFCNTYDMRAIALRYFNPIGADPGMRTGSFLKNPTHLLGKLLQTYYSENKEITITGTEWETRDGTGLRDYIHVSDLARAHVYAVEKISEVFSDRIDGNFIPINLGRGEGITVKELITIFEQTVHQKFNILYAPPREGDVAGAYANCKLAEEILGWKSEKSIQDAIRDALEWESLKKSKKLERQNL